MTRTDIKKALDRVSKNQAFITATELATALGQKNSYRVKQKYLAGLECISGKYYLITEVAQRLQELKGA